jgi:dipeptidyl-peptidase-4
MKTKKLHILLLLTLGLLIPGNTYTQITIDNILNGKYTPQTTGEYRSMPDGEHYTRLSPDHRQILRYAWKTQTVVDTLFNTATTRETRLDHIDGYQISNAGHRIIVWTNREQIYRHSWQASLYDYDVRRNYLKPLSDQPGNLRLPHLSPDGRMCAYVHNNNIRIKKFDYDTEIQITTDGEQNKIINGATDWVYEEEFGATSLITWSPDSRYLAYVRTDETAVPIHQIQNYDNTPHPSQYRYKYPKPGEPNSTVTVHIYDTDTKKTKPVDLPVDPDSYIPGIQFTGNPDQLAITTLNRHQDHLNIYYTNPLTTVTKHILSDQNRYYIEPEHIHSIIFTPTHIIRLSEQSGYAHIHLYTINGIPERQITTGNWDVTALYGIDPQTQTIYYQSAEESPLRRSIYKIDQKGTKTRLSQQQGTNTATFSSNFKYHINHYTSATTPPHITLHDNTGRQLSILADNTPLRQKLDADHWSHKEFFTFTNNSGETLNGYIIKPADFDPTRRYPVVITQYSGPSSQTVLDQYQLDWQDALPPLGYIVASIDPRGTGARGQQFRKSTHLQLGILESDDQAAGAKYLATLPWVDPSRIAIQGWSFGGYNVLMTMTRHPGTFRAGIAIAPVTDWRFYDTIYTERYMHTPQENETGYNTTSPLRNADRLTGRLLLIHGTSDDNVHYQNTALFAKALQDAGIQFDQHTYPGKNHSISGTQTRSHLYHLIINFLNQNLR